MYCIILNNIKSRHSNVTLSQRILKREWKNSGSCKRYSI